MVLTDIAPGVDLQKDVLPRLESTLKSPRFEVHGFFHFLAENDHTEQSKHLQPFCRNALKNELQLALGGRRDNLPDPVKDYL
jgi:hypothetical protein